MQFVINNWYLFLALAVTAYLLLVGPVMQAVRGIKTLPVAQADWVSAPRRGSR